MTMVGWRQWCGRGWRLGLMACVLALAACGARVDLLTQVPEDEANTVLSALLDEGVAAVRQTGKDGVTITVPQESVAHALEVLAERGLPRARFDGMGQVFRKEGLVSSPLEERARYIYALSQELAATLSQMDGVLVARVHVVLPERGSVGETPTPSTAAVFLKHQAGLSLDVLQPQIRRLVTHSIPGLTEDRVSVVLVSAQPGQARVVSPPAATVPTALWVALAALGVLVLGLAGALGWLFWRSRRTRTSTP